MATFARLIEMPDNQTIIINPIKEIIFGVSFAENISLDCLNKFISIEEIKQTFPVIKPGYNTNLKTTNDGNPPVPDVKKAGYILKCDNPCNRILQAKMGLFAFHKTKEYENYENLVYELNGYWEAFQKCTGQLIVTKVSLRYLNFIDTEEKEKNADYLNIITTAPFDNITNDFSQIKFKVDEKTDAIIVVTNGKDGVKNGIILDLILNRNISNKSFDNIGNAFEGMRYLKNDIFQKIITTKTKEKYNL
jgi:uncharacterized protein (TIGR04255 family)